MFIPDAMDTTVSGKRAEVGNSRVNLLPSLPAPPLLPAASWRLYFPWPCFPVRKASEALEFHLHCRHSNKLKSFTERESKWTQEGKSIPLISIWSYSYKQRWVVTNSASGEYTPGHMHKISQRIFLKQHAENLTKYSLYVSYDGIWLHSN